MKKQFVSILIVLLIFYATFNYFGVRSIVLPRQYPGNLDYFWHVVKEVKAKRVSVYVGAFSKIGTMITVYGNVTKVLSRDITPPRHEIFLLGDLNDSSKHLKIIYNVDYLGRGWLNVKVGDLIVLIGELLPDAKSVHKVAEGLDLLTLFRPNDNIIIEVGYLPENDSLWLALIALIDISILIAVVLIRKRGFI